MKIALDGGGEIAIERLDGERAEGAADRARPPGSRHEGSVDGRRVRLKVERCLAAKPGPFWVRVRFIDLERDLREKILRSGAQPPEGSAR